MPAGRWEALTTSAGPLGGNGSLAVMAVAAWCLRTPDSPGPGYFSTVVDLRDHLELGPLLGPFSDRLPFGVDLSGLSAPSFHDVLLRTQAGFLDAVVHYLPYDEVVALGVELGRIAPRARPPTGTSPCTSAATHPPAARPGASAPWPNRACPSSCSASPTCSARPPPCRPTAGTASPSTSAPANRGPTPSWSSTSTATTPASGTPSTCSRCWTARWTRPSPRPTRPCPRPTPPRPRGDCRDRDRARPADHRADLPRRRQRRGAVLDLAH
ncbi:hypothetical protein ACFQ2B_31740 [Streptomyces stramineus]